MTIFDMLEQSGIFTLLGMGIVFSFLVILIITISLAGKLIRAVGMGDSGQPAPAAGKAPAADAGAVTAAISAAVSEYQKAR
jgi:oxaloacetate decarboxylase gamma subunit